MLDEAIWVYSRVIKLSPDYPDAYLNMGKVMLHKGALDEAIMAFRKTVRLQPGDYRAYYYLGDIYCKQGRLFEAMIELQQALRLNPGHADTAHKLQAVMDAIAGSR